MDKIYCEICKRELIQKYKIIYCRHCNNNINSMAIQSIFNKNKFRKEENK